MWDVEGSARSGSGAAAEQPAVLLFFTITAFTRFIAAIRRVLSETLIFVGLADQTR